MDKLAEIGYAMYPPLIMQAAGLTPDEWQRKLLADRPSNLLLNCSRQSGKSTVVAAMAVDSLLAGGLVLAICPSEKQSKELLRTTAMMYQKIGWLPAQKSVTCIECSNGARMFALPSSEETIRGFSGVALLLIDEASRVSDDLYNAVTPMVAVSKGRIAALSTPWGKRGWWFKEWTEGKDWYRVRITADQCPRMTPEFLEIEQRRKGRSIFRQEYFCEFADTEGSVFSFDDIAAGADPTLRPLFPAHLLNQESVQ